MRRSIRRSKKISISNLVILFMILLIILQSLLFLSMTAISDTGRQLELNSISYIAKNLSFNRLIVQRSMNDLWGNIDNLHTVISDAKKHGLKDDHALQIELVDHMLDALHILKVSKITAVLYNENEKDTVISLLDYNPMISSHDNEDNTLFYGDKKIAEQLGLKVDKDWSEQIREDDTKYFREYREKTEKLSTRAAINGDRKVSSWEYYSKPNGEKYWHYLVPLIGDINYDPVGFLVVEINVGLVMDSLHRSENTDQYLKGYVLLQAPTAKCEVGESIELQVMGTQIDEKSNFFDGPTAKIKRIRNDYELQFESIDSTFVADDDSGRAEGYEFYLSSVNFINTDDYSDYYLLVVIDKNEMNQPVKNFERGIFFVLGGSLLIGTLLTILLSNVLSANAKRITEQVRRLQKTDGDVNFKASSISEFDMLLEEIRILRVSLRESADKFESIFAIADFPVVALEIDEKAGVVYKVGRIYDVLKIEAHDNEPDDFVKEVGIDYYLEFREYFLKTHRKYISYKDEDDSDIDIWENISSDDKNYLKIVTDRGERTVSDFSSAVTKTTITRPVVLKVITNCTDEILEQNRLKEERDKDTLTGLLNRFSFKKKVEKILQAGECKAAMIMWDLDDLKFVNDAYGHDAGDIYIKAMADILRRLEGEGAAVARISGDEFFAFLSYQHDKAEIREMVQKIKTAMAGAELYFSNQVMAVKATTGIAWYPDDTADLNDLHKYADFAMYTAKHTLKGTIAEFNKEQFDSNYIMLIGNQHFENFIKEKQVKFVYQPIVNSRTGEIVAYEAFMRPTSEQIRTVDIVLRVAKQQHRMNDVELLTLEMVLEYVSKNKELFEGKRIFINSIANIAIPEEEVYELDRKFPDLLPRCVIEIVEEEDIERECLKIKQEAKLKLSMQIAIDHYGRGDFNRTWLRTVGPDYIKIDMNLIRDIEGDQVKIDIIKAIIDQAKKSEIYTICEGVETYSEMKTLIRMGVDFLQGYYVSRPEFEPKGISDKVREEIVQLNVIPH